MISVEFNGQHRLLQAIDKLTSRTHRRELMDQIGSYGVASTQQRFLDQKSPDGETWEKSSRAKEHGGQTLRDRGHLFQSMTHEASADHTAWGTNVIYAAIHQMGGDIKAKTSDGLKFFVGNRFVNTDKVSMPARPFLGVNRTDETEINAIIEDWVEEVIR